MLLIFYQFQIIKNQAEQSAPPDSVERLFLVADSCLSRRKSCDRYAERRAGDVIEADLVAELDGGRISAVFAADAAVKLGSDLLAEG